MRVLDHSIERDVNETIYVNDQQVPLQRLSVSVQRGARAGRGRSAHKQRLMKRKEIYGVSLRVVDLKEKVDEGSLVRYVLHTNIPVDFDVQLDDSGRRLLLTGPGVLEWAIEESKAFAKKILLQSYSIKEEGDKGNDAIELKFKRPVKLDNASVVGNSFVVSVIPKKALTKKKRTRSARGLSRSRGGHPQNAYGSSPQGGGAYGQGDPFVDSGYDSEADAMGDGSRARGAASEYDSDYEEGYESIEPEEDLPQVKKVVVTESTDITTVDFHLTDMFESKAFVDHNGDVVAELPYTIWDVVDVDELQRRGLFVDYSISSNVDIRKTKVRLMLQKGTKLLQAQNLNEGGKYILRIILSQDESYLSPDWLARHGTSALAMTNAEKAALQTKHLVYRGGISDTVSIGERFELGLDVGVSMAQLTHDGATLPYRYLDEPFTRVRFGVPVYGNPDLKLMLEGSYTKTLSGWDYTAGLHYGNLFYQGCTQAMTHNATLLATARLVIPLGVASVVFLRGGMGAGYFLDYEEDRVPKMKEMEPRRTYYVGGGVNTAILDCLTIGIELGYERTPALLRPNENDEKYSHDWSGFLSSFSLSYTPKPMSGPSALSSQTFVNTGFFMDAGVQFIASNYFVAVGDDKTKASSAWRDRRLMNGWRVGVGYLFFRSPMAFSAELEIAARDVVLAKLMQENLKDTTIDVHAGWDVGIIMKPGYMVNHGVRAFLMVGGLQRWYSQVSGPQADKEASEAVRRSLLKEGVGKYKLLAAVLGMGFSIFATKNVSFDISYACNLFPDHVWHDHHERAYRVGLYEGIWRMCLGYNF